MHNNLLNTSTVHITDILWFNIVVVTECWRWFLHDFLGCGFHGLHHLSHQLINVNCYYKKIVIYLYICTWADPYIFLGGGRLRIKNNYCSVLQKLQ